MMSSACPCPKEPAVTADPSPGPPRGHRIARHPLGRRHARRLRPGPDGAAAIQRAAAGAALPALQTSSPRAAPSCATATATAPSISVDASIYVPERRHAGRGRRGRQHRRAPRLRVGRTEPADAVRRPRADRRRRTRRWSARGLAGGVPGLAGTPAGRGAGADGRHRRSVPSSPSRAPTMRAHARPESSSRAGFRSRGTSRAPRSRRLLKDAGAYLDRKFAPAAGAAGARVGARAGRRRRHRARDRLTAAFDAARVSARGRRGPAGRARRRTCGSRRPRARSTTPACACSASLCTAPGVPDIVVDLARHATPAAGRPPAGVPAARRTRSTSRRSSPTRACSATATATSSPIARKPCWWSTAPALEPVIDLAARIGLESTGVVAPAGLPAGGHREARRPSPRWCSSARRTGSSTSSSRRRSSNGPR